jgi:Family of unknown function (DUF6459)
MSAMPLAQYQTDRNAAMHAPTQQVDAYQLTLDLGLLEAPDLPESTAVVTTAPMPAGARTGVAWTAPAAERLAPGVSDRVGMATASPWGRTAGNVRELAHLAGNRSHDFAGIPDSRRSDHIKEAWIHKLCETVLEASFGIRSLEQVRGRMLPKVLKDVGDARDAVLRTNPRPSRPRIKKVSARLVGVGQKSGIEVWGLLLHGDRTRAFTMRLDLASEFKDLMPPPRRHKTGRGRSSELLVPLDGSSADVVLGSRWVVTHTQVI